MKRQNVIIISELGKIPQVWGNLKKYCNYMIQKGDKRFKYNTLSRKKMPIIIGNIIIYREPFN